MLSAEPVAGRATRCLRRAAGSCPAWSTRTATSGWARAAPPTSTRPSRQAETERDAGALLLRDAGSPIDTRSLDDRDDLPRIIRAGRHLARPKRYMPGLPIDIEDESQLPAAVAEQARRGDGWVKLVGDWIDRGVGDLAPLWSDDVLKAAIAAAHANGARVTAHVFGEDALPGLIKAGIDCIEHGTGLTDDTIDADGRARHRAGAHADQHRELPRHRRRRGQVPGLRQAHARPVRVVPRTRVGAAREAGVPIYAGTDAGGMIAHGRIADEVDGARASG